MRDTIKVIPDRPLPAAGPQAGPPASRRPEPGAVIARELIPSSPWLTLEEASRRTGLGLRVLKTRLREQATACPGMTCGSGENAMVKAEALGRFLGREHPAAEAGGGGREGRRGRRQVRAERVDSSCGSLGHMTVDEIRQRTLGAEVNLSCPECGGIHLSREEALEAASLRLTSSPCYQRIKRQAEME